MQRQGKTSIQYYEQKQTGSEVSVSTKAHILKSQAPVLKVEPANTAESDVLAIQEDGTLTAFSSDGATIKYKCLLKTSPDPISILDAHYLSKVEAQSSVLKSRQDLISTVPDDAVFLAVVYQGGESKDLNLGIWASPNLSVPLEPLIWHSLDQLKTASIKKTHIEFVSGHKKLEIDTSSLVTTFDITTIVPQKLSERKSIVPDSISRLDLSPEITLYMTPGKLQIYNKTFSALQASSNSNMTTLKRKRGADNTSRMTLIAYFAQMRKVLAFNGTQVLSIDVRPIGGSQNPFKQGSLLIGNILRGCDRSDQTDRSPPSFKCSIGRVEREGQVKDWSIISKDLDVLAQAKDAKGFEERFKTTFSLQKPKDLISSKLPPSKANYLLCKIFAPTSTDGDVASKNFKVDLVLPDLLRWCMSSGLLESSRVAGALQLNQAAVKSTAVAQALLEGDSQHELLDYYIQHSPFLQPEVLSFVAKALINQALHQSESEIQLLPTANAEIEMVNPVPIQQLVLGSRPDEMSTNTPTSTCLARTLKRLAVAGSAIVSGQLRSSSFDQRQILAMIQFLRQQLFLGGYSRLAEMRSYPSPPASNTGEEGENEKVSQQRISLEGIVILLNGCIDALGPIGILGSAEERAFVERMVPELLSEVTSASQAVGDSTFLQGILRETLRYAESVERQPFEVRSKVENKEVSAVGTGQIITLYSEPDSADPVSSSRSALPLSLKAEEDIDKFKVRKGGQLQRRSAREIGMLKDRLKSPYSFERLVL